jgi:hypothetical protein
LIWSRDHFGGKLADPLAATFSCLRTDALKLRHFKYLKMRQSASGFQWSNVTITVIDSFYQFSAKKMRFSWKPKLWLFLGMNM